ncbi:solute carrier family 22 member 7-like [Littorina saxatilis]|uniref:Major facilitator superfamily (MFS) profile domain-containing protein n=1 Tax=Littorina saxatilis TaxID=31220 RepID=A0AAN9G0G8_9CAEN
MHVEDLIDQMGAFGRYQMLVTSLALGPVIATAWSLLSMSFSSVVPDWWCVTLGSGVANLTRDSPLYKYCPDEASKANGTAIACTRVYAQGVRTVVTEWDLVCEKSWVTSTVTSIQMAGVLTGALLAGQSADLWGRRTINFGFTALMIVANLVAALSVAWQMYAVTMFFIGLSCGVVLVVGIQMAVECTGAKWRTVHAAIPFWQTGVAVFALFSYLLEDWQHLHFASAAIYSPLVLGWIILPESVRWLATQNRLEDAEKAVETIARYNRCPKPTNALAKLRMVAEEAKHEATGAARKYTYLDVYRSWKMFRRSLCSNVIWFSSALVFYVISLGVQKLSFNLYLNIFLIGCADIPCTFLSFYLTRTCFGRRWAAASFYFLTCACCIGIVIASVTATEENKGAVMNYLAIAAKLCLGGGWDVMTVFSTEIYPTVIRSLGYGASSAFARIGGIVAPFIALMTDNLVLPYSAMSVLMLLSGACALLLPETRLVAMEDLIIVKTCTSDVSDVMLPCADVSENSLPTLYNEKNKSDEVHVRL